MRRLWNRIPSVEDLGRNRAKIGGFIAGALGTLLLGLFVGVVYTGESAIAAHHPDEHPVYPNF